MDVKQLFENFKTVLIRHYADFNGRASRAAFWQYILVCFVVGILLWFLGLRLVRTVLGVALFLPTLAVTVRRLHDIGKSGWWVLLPLVPFIIAGMFVFVFWPLAMVASLAGLICAGYLIYLCAQPGGTAENQFGPAPGIVEAPV